MKLKKGIIEEVQRKRGDWRLRVWNYTTEDGVVLGVVYKQLYPRDTHFTYRYELKGLSMLTTYYKKAPNDGLSIISEHYLSKKAAIRGLKKALKAYIRLFDTLLEPE